MRATAFAQILVERNSLGQARGAHIAKVTQKFPHTPLSGAFVVKLVVELPNDIANVQTYEAAVKAGAVTFVVPPVEETS